MASLKDVVETNETALGRWFDLGAIVVILVSLVTFSVETLPNLPPTIDHALWYVELVCVGLFTVEYLLRIAVAEDKRRFIFSFYGLIHLAAILPFYLSLGIDLRSVRIFRLFRLFRIFKLARYSRAARRFHRALLIAREELVLFGMSALFVLYLSAVGIYYCENEAQPEAFASVFHSLWWAVCTLTTVGYGDVYPVTLAGRVFTFFVLITGIGIISVPAGLLASALSKARELEAQEPSPQDGDEGDGAGECSSRSGARELGGRH